MTTRSTLRAALMGASGLATVGILVVSSFPPSPNNLGLDCRISVVAGGRIPGNYECVAVVLPNKNSPPDECAALLATGGEPPGAGLDAGFINARVGVERAFEAMRKANAIETWHCDPLLDAGSPCICELRANVIVNADGTFDGQAPALHDVITTAADAGTQASIFLPGNARIVGGCRKHVFAGEAACATSVGLDAGP